MVGTQVPGAQASIRGRLRARGIKPYKVETSKQKDLGAWSKQGWRTASGRKSSVTGEPYFLPRPSRRSRTRNSTPSQAPEGRHPRRQATCHLFQGHPGGRGQYRAEDDHTIDTSIPIR